MTKTMEMLWNLKEMGVAVTCSDLDQCLEKELGERVSVTLDAMLNRLQSLEHELLHGGLPGGWEKDKHEQTVKYTFGRIRSMIYRCWPDHTKEPEAKS